MDFAVIGHLIWMNILLLTGLMGVSLLYYFFRRNGAILDLAWASGFSIVATTSFVGCDGYLVRKFMVFFMAILWSVLLGRYWLQQYNQESKEGRFQALKESFKAYSNVKFGALFLMQGIVIVVIAWPFILISSNTTPSISHLEWSAFALWCVAMIGEAISERQMLQFTALPENRFKVCQKGLWRYSRHPNYFFGWLVWVAFSVMALDASWGLTAIVSPLMMWYLMSQVSGIAAAEEQSLQSKGDEYKQYQKKTNRILPWFPK